MVEPRFNNDGTCAICTDDFAASPENPVVMLGCEHHYCKSCIERWVSQEQSHSNKCPQCRQPIQSAMLITNAEGLLQTARFLLLL